MFRMGHTTSPVKALFGGIIAGVIGLAFAGMGIWQLGRVSRAEGWATAPGVIQTSEVTTSRGSKGRTRYHCRVSYIFEVSGTRYSGNTLAVGDQSSGSSWAHEKQRQYPAGGPCTVHYDPSNPTDCCLEIGSRTTSWIFIAIGGVLVLIGAGATVKRLVLP